METLPDFRVAETEQKPAEIRFHITQERVENMRVKDLIAYEENPSSAKLAVGLFANFMLGANGSYIARAEAMTILGELTVGEMNKLGEVFRAQWNNFTLPNSNGKPL